MTLRQLVEQEQARAVDVATRRGEAKAAELAYHRARDKLAYYTRKRDTPESAMQLLRDELHSSRVAYQRARRALVRAL